MSTPPRLSPSSISSQCKGGRCVWTTRCAMGAGANCLCRSQGREYASCRRVVGLYSTKTCTLQTATGYLLYSTAAPYFFREAVTAGTLSLARNTGELAPIHLSVIVLYLASPHFKTWQCEPDLSPNLWKREA